MIGEFWIHPAAEHPYITGKTLGERSGQTKVNNIPSTTITSHLLALILNGTYTINTPQSNGWF